MALKLMYITNQPDVAVIAEKAGVDRIWIDLETIGKEQRQKHINSVKSHHSLEDIKKVRPVLSKSSLQVRINPIYRGSEKEIDTSIKYGADIIMLPMFKTIQEVNEFIEIVDGRAIALLLLETKEAVEQIDEILNLKGIDEIHIGLNDLHLSYEKRFMFELLADGTIDKLCEKFKKKNLAYGFGGIAKMGKGKIPAEYIIKEHYRLGSTRAILSRSFCNTKEIVDMAALKKTFATGIQEIRAFEQKLPPKTNKEFYEENRCQVEKMICNIVNYMAIIER